MDKQILDILKSMQNDMQSIQSDMKLMQNDMKLMQSDIQSIKTTQDEHTQILRALEHKTNILSAEQENLKYEVSEVKGDVKSIRKDLNCVELITANNWSDIVKLKSVK